LEVDVSRIIIEDYMEELLNSLETKVVVVGAGPSGLVASYYLAKHGIDTVVLERNLSIGGGMWGGGMMFNRIVVQEEARPILEEFSINFKEIKGKRKEGERYYSTSSIEAISKIAAKALDQGVKIFNLISVEDLIVANNRVRGVVINWTSVELSKLHVDPLVIKSEYVIDATGHESSVCRVIAEKIGELRIRGEGPMWAEKGEKLVVENTREIYPGLIVTGMAANAVSGSPRMGPIFGGMFLSGKKAAEIAINSLR